MIHHRHVGAIASGGAAAAIGAAASAAAGALVLYVKAHALKIGFSAAFAAVVAYAETRDIDQAIERALKKGMHSAAESAVRDFLQLKWNFG